MSPETTAGVDPAFSFHGIRLRKASFSEVPGAEVSQEPKPSSIEANIQMSAHMRTTQEPPFRAEVTLTLSIAPDPKWQPYVVEVVITGMVAAQTEMPFSAFDEFCRRGVPTILFPYARHIIHSLTVDGVGGAVHLQPLNIAKSLEAGWRQNPTSHELLPESEVAPDINPSSSS